MSRSYSYLFFSRSVHGIPRSLDRLPGARHDVSDGHRRWGEYAFWPSAQGTVMNHRLVVFPPGISAARTRLLRVWRTWPEAGLIGLLGVLVLLTAPGGRILAAVVAGIYAGIYLTLARKTEWERRGVRRLSAVDVGDDATVDDLTRCTQLRLLYLQLARADDELAAGELCPAEYAAVWREVYARMA